MAPSATRRTHWPSPTIRHTLYTASCCSRSGGEEDPRPGTFVADTADRLWIGGLRAGRIEWMGAVANRLPMIVVARLIGVPKADVDKLLEWGYAGTQLLEGCLCRPAHRRGRIRDWSSAATSPIISRGRPPTPKTTCSATSAAACAAGELDDVVALSVMITLFAAGGESTASLLGSAAWILATRPDIQRQIRENPELLGAFIDETLRYEPPFRGHYRHVTADTALCGTELRAASRLLLLWGAANRDPAHFHAPDEFRLDRADGKGHIAFGKGAHFCVGATLARLEATVVLRRVA